MLGALLIASVACGSSKATGPQYPEIAGTYVATFGGSVTPLGYAAQSLGSSSGTITIATPGSDGSFEGVYTTAGTSGTIVGEEGMDGTVVVTQFGPPGVTPLANLAALAQAYPDCAWSKYTTSGLTGSVAGTSLTLSITVVLPCVWVVSASNVVLTTDFESSITAVRATS